MTIVTILLMALITFTTRYLFIHPKMPIRLGEKMFTFLSFSAPAVLTAIWVPIIFIREEKLDTSLTNPYLIAASVAIVISVKSKNIYFTLFVSVSVFATSKLLL